MIDHTASDAEREQQFRDWFASEERRREVARLQREVARLENLQFATYILMLLWVLGTAIAYRVRPDLIPADVAGLITVSMFVGGGLLVWYVIRLKRELRRRLNTLAPEPSRDS